jgi:hypothetical protein
MTTSSTFSGNGILKFHDGAIYNGTWLNGKMAGFGEMILPSKARYVGEWKDNRQDGKGTDYDTKSEWVGTGNWKKVVYVG